MKTISSKKIIYKNITLKILIIIFASALIFSCAPKPAALEGTKILTVEYLAKGQTIFKNSCAKCHDLPDPEEHSARDWVGIMNSMAPKAKLNDSQHEMVYDYIISAKK